MSGWYPDPGGEPDRYRYWDGTVWSNETTPDPSRPPPTPGSSSGRRPPVALIVVTAAIVMAALVVVWLVRESGAGRPYTDDPLPSTSLSGGDDSSPQPSPAAPSPSPSASPEGTAACVAGDPNRRDYAPADGRVHGGNLSFPAAPELDPPGDEPRFSFAWDVSQQIKGVHDRPGWIAQLALGRLRAADGFDDGARRVAEQAMRCTVTSNMYEPYVPTRKDRRSEPITVDGVRGWLIESDITVEVSGLPFGGDRVHLIVLPDGDDHSFYFSATPLGDATFAAVAARTQRALTIS